VVGWRNALTNIGEGIAFIQRLQLPDDEFEYLTKHPLLWMMEVFTEERNGDLMEVLSSHQLAFEKPLESKTPQPEKPSVETPEPQDHSIETRQPEETVMETSEAA